MIDPNVTAAYLNTQGSGNMAGYLGIEFTEVGKDHLSAKMPVDHRTIQPMGLLHGGANAVLAETLGSMASYLSIDPNEYYSVGLEIKCNHLRGITSGHVYGAATPVHLGKRTHVWQIEIHDEQGRKTCFSTITMAILPLTEEMKAHQANASG